MIFKVNKSNQELEKITSYWNIKELELENLLIPNNDISSSLSDEIFGEELFFVSNQVLTEHRKRADIYAVDKNGNGVVIELKKDDGIIGVETQALQYVADFNQYKGTEFLDRFNLKDKEGVLLNFVNDNIEIKDLNKYSRIIIIARDFDPSLYSMGEWLAENDIAFKCISFTPIRILDECYLQFSIKFDQKTPNTKTRLLFSNRRSSETKNFWHNIGNNKDWWSYLVQNNVISASFDNLPGDKGESILRKYIKGDTVFAYLSGVGCIGYGIISKGVNGYDYIKKDSDEDQHPEKGLHLHRLSINWKAVIKDFTLAISSFELKEKYNISHPIQTSSTIKNGDVEGLKAVLSKRNELIK